MVHRELKTGFIQKFRRHARFDEIDHEIECLCGQLSSLAHAGEGFGAEKLDLARFPAGGEGGVDKGHGRSVWVTRVA